MTANGTSWKRLPAPIEREDLGLAALFTRAEAERIVRGFIPKEMEDKWFIYFEDAWLFFHRSWTGVLVYALRLDDSPAGTRVVESWSTGILSSTLGQTPTTTAGWFASLSTPIC